MSETSPQLPRLATGIPGLDPLLEGGLPVGGVFLVQGEPGTGKTILGNQMCFHHASTGQQAVYLTLLAESHARMFSHLRRFAFFDSEKVGQSVHYHAGFRVLEEHGAKGLLDLTRNAVVERQATLIVIDGLVNAGEMTPSRTEFKLLLHSIQTISTTLGCTIVLLSSGGRDQAGLPEHTVVDGIIRLTRTLASLHAIRHIEITKMRGVDAVMGCHTVEIESAGMYVRPRLESRLLVDRSVRSAPARTARVPLGIPTLDEMMHGGLPPASNTVLAGPTGTGKTILSLQYLAAGAPRGERGLYFGFYERPETILQKADRIGIPLSQAVKDGQVEIQWERPVEGVLDAVSDRLLTRIQQTGITRLAIDGLAALRRTVDSPERIHAAIAALTEELERLGVTTVSTLETPELFGMPTSLPLEDISAVSQNLLLLRHVHQADEVQRMISIIKMRDSDFDPRMCRVTIASGGVQVVDGPQKANRPA